MPNVIFAVILGALGMTAIFVMGALAAMLSGESPATIAMLYGCASSMARVGLVWCAVWFLRYVFD